MKSQPLILATLFVLAACGAKSGPPSDQPSSAPNTVEKPGVVVVTAPLMRRSISGTVSATGQVVADAGGQATLAFPTDGQIASIAVNVGDHVARGQILASLDTRVSGSAIAQAQADVVAARANLARAQLRARPQEFAQNSAQVQAARAKADTAKAEYDRQAALAKVGISAQRELQQAQSAYQGALADLRIAQQQGSILSAGPRPQDVQVASAAVAQADAALGAAEARASLSYIVAPFDGIVTQRMKNVGETVDTTIPVIGIVNPGRMVVEVQLAQDQAALVHAGDTATITTSNSATARSARVIEVSPALSQETRTMTVRLRLGGAALIPGSSATASIVVRSLVDAFVVPDSAVVKDPETGDPVIYLLQGRGTYRSVPVRILLQSNGRTALVAAGLHSGQRVVTQGSYELLPFAGGPGGG